MPKWTEECNVTSGALLSGGAALAFENASVADDK